MCFEKLLNSTKIKKLLISILIGVMSTSVAVSRAQKTLADITGNVVRLHILANSNSDADQSLKLKVRDDVSTFLVPLLEKSQSVEEAKYIISQNIENIEEEAQKSIKKHGCSYDATAVLDKFDFPQKSYENATFPAGEYDALRISIGEGEGKNWWCVLYPQLCFFVSEKGEFSAESKNKLKNVLTDDEYSLITSKNVELKFKLLELFANQ